MTLTRLIPYCFALAVIAGVPGHATAQTVGPDVIIGNLFGPISFPSNSGITTFSVGTDACNIGDRVLWWIGGNNVHPVIAQALYRIQDGRFEQLGISWLKHGFAAANGNLCGTCTPAAPTALGVYCSDAYGAGTNAAQSTLGPRSDVNPTTGWFAFPQTLSPPPTTIGGRLQVRDDDLDPALNPGARYFIEAHYVHPEDALWGNDDNNATWCEVDITGAAPNFSIALAGPSVPQEPAIRAWAANDPEVQIQEVDVPLDGRFIVAMKRQPLAGGLARYVYVLHNLNSDRAAGGFSVSLPQGATATNLTFHDVDYHSGEPQNGTDWSWTVAPNGVAWITAEPHAVNPNANALRFATCYTFSFVSNAPPGDPTIELFKPGTPASVTVPAFYIPVTEWQENQPGAHFDIDGLSNNALVGPIVVEKTTGSAGLINISSTESGNPYFVGITPAVAIPDPAGTSAGQHININLGHPSITLFGTTSPLIVPPSPQVLPFTAPTTPGVLTFQMAVAQPSSMDGYALSAANELRTVTCNNPIPVPTGGPNSDDSATTFTLGSGGLCAAPFVFYGTAHTTIHVASNGRIIFGNQFSNAVLGDWSATLSEALNQGPCVGFWTDLNPAANGVITVDVPLPNTVVASYQGLPYFAEPTSSVSFDIVLDTSTGTVTLDNLGGIGPNPQNAGSDSGDAQFFGISASAGGLAPPPTTFSTGSSGFPVNPTDMIYDWFDGTSGGGGLVPSLQGASLTSVIFSPMGTGYMWTAL